MPVVQFVCFTHSHVGMEIAIYLASRIEGANHVIAVGIDPAKLGEIILRDDGVKPIRPIIIESALHCPEPIIISERSIASSMHIPHISNGRVHSKHHNKLYRKYR